MKMFFFPLLFFAISAYSQSNLSQNDVNTQPSKKQRWDLDTYVWSHTHYKISEKDKPVIDFNAIDNWPGLGEYLAISADGRFIAYNTIKGSGLPSYAQKQDSLIIQSTVTSWRRTFPAINKGFFSADGKQYIFQDKERLCFLKTGSDQISFAYGVASYKVPASNNAEWLAYQLKTNNGVVLQNLATGKVKIIDNVSSFDFDNSSKWLVCQLNNESKELQLYNLKKGKDLRFASADVYAISKAGNSLVLKRADKGLSFTNLVTAKTIEIWHPVHAGQTIKEFAQDEDGSQVVFTVEGENKTNTIWYYREGMNSAVMKANSETKGIDNMAIESSVSFTDNGNYIQISLIKKPDLRQPISDAVQIDVWSYKDTVLQPEQKYLAGTPKKFSAVIDLKKDKVIRLEKENETLYLLQGDFAIIKKHGRDIHGSRFWEEGYYEDSNWLFSFKEDKRILLPTKGDNYTLCFSPSGKYLVFFDANKSCHYFSYNLTTNNIKDISSTIPSNQLGFKDFYLHTDDKPTSPAGIAGWVKEEEELLVYDNYDIWQLDPSGEKPAINLTNGYGSLHHILLNSENINRGLFGNDLLVSGKEPLLLTAFNQINKYNGYYRKSLGKVGDPEFLYMGPCVISSVSATTPDVGGGKTPLKANNCDVWVVQQQSANFAPNYFVTKDFKNYKQLSYIQPQKDYNWLTAELISFKQLDGSMSQGILYKPENFDSTKKYTVIIPVYTQNSDALHFYPTPNYTEDPIGPLRSPIWMVSHGYIVFLPDIYFTKNNWGPSTVNTIDGAANYLKTLPYVDSNHLGTMGFSFSGRFGYYLLTHSKSFAAMSIGSGYMGTDVISLALSLDFRDNRKSNLQFAEKEATAGLGNLWENKALWMDHTAVLQADNAISPLLLFHNSHDGDDPRAAVELYTAFRRLKKPLWWVQYDQGFHSLFRMRDFKDFTIRFTQFFDHFLKQAPAPKWMTQGIPAAMKGIETGYDLDPSGSCGKDCKVCKKWGE